MIGNTLPERIYMYRQNIYQIVNKMPLNIFSFMKYAR